MCFSALTSAPRTAPAAQWGGGGAGESLKKVVVAGTGEKEAVDSRALPFCKPRGGEIWSVFT